MFQSGTELREKFPDEWQEKKFKRRGEESLSIQECFVGELEIEKGFTEHQIADGSFHAEVVLIVLEKQIKLVIFWRQSLDQEYIT